MKKIGIIGGSFDPIHIGHINLALDAKEQCDLDEVIFMPVKLQPFKIDKDMADSKSRVEMIRLAIKDYDRLELSLHEVLKKEISYTYKTLAELHEIFGEECKIYFICGTDSFLSMLKWKEHEKLLTNNSIIVGTRPGYKEEEVKKLIKEMVFRFDTEIIKIDNKQYNISATEIRERLKNNDHISDLVVKDVERYIKDNGLYS